MKYAIAVVMILVSIGASAAQEGKDAIQILVEKLEERDTTIRRLQDDIYKLEFDVELLRQAGMAVVEKNRELQAANKELLVMAEKRRLMLAKMTRTYANQYKQEINDRVKALEKSVSRSFETFRSSIKEF